jgi:hypothetical protein
MMTACIKIEEILARLLRLFRGLRFMSGDESSCFISMHPTSARLALLLNSSSRIAPALLAWADFHPGSYR